MRVHRPRRRWESAYYIRRTSWSDSEIVYLVGGVVDGGELTAYSTLCTIEGHYTVYDTNVTSPNP